MSYSTENQESPLPNLPGLDIIIGPMVSSKTTELLRRLFICSAGGIIALYVNHSLDNRNPEAHYSTHNPLYKKKLTDEHGVKMCAVNQLSELSDDFLKNFQIIAVDESHFFPDLKERIIYFVDVLQKHVIVAGLNGDYQREKFGQILDLIPYCDHLHKLSSYCKPCSTSGKGLVKALFTHRKIDQTSDQIQIGATDQYIPVCRKCYLSLNS